MANNKKPMGGAKTPSMACRKVCENHSDHQQGIFCGYADSLAECATLCAHITCKEDLPTGFSSGGDSSAGGGTGQPAAWRNVGGTILGYTTQQVLIAVGVGVAAYFLYKKFK
jgi:hypothetical protein